ncbi:hypothetical protein E2C01_014500 [Portunus trituberculatus]|uniref:Uncharacterized protein n=1 Tax=Portunus trituberculatus TaxID=210409 RepID=A0A5B7DJ01_PORTR|nr:hypothetical protein [Portunus trituberculatus]
MASKCPLHEIMVLPNSELQNTQSTGNETKQQLSPLSHEAKSCVLFALGIAFASSLFVFLIVIVILVCTWARRAKGYTVGDQDCEVTNQVFSDADCQLTKHTERFCEKKRTKNSISAKKDQLKSCSLAALPNPPVRTVAVTTQVTPKNSKEGSVDDDDQNFYIHEPKSYPVIQPKCYGTLGRTHLLSTVDDDGYHVDNLGFDSEEVTAEEVLPTLDKKQPTATVYQHDFPDINKSYSTIQPSIGEGQSVKANFVAEIDSSNQENKLQKQLSKQDSFQGLPPLKSFDRYLTLVRLDSDTSLEAYSLEETRRIWKSIDEDDEEEELRDNSKKEEP